MTIKLVRSRFKSLEWYVYIVSVILECAGIGFMVAAHRSICIRAYEMSGPVMFFILCNVVVLLLDIIYVLTIVFSQFLGKEPTALMYNLVTGFFILGASCFVVLKLTDCGNKAQDLIMYGAYVGIAAGVVHLINSYYSHWYLPREEVLENIY